MTNKISVLIPDGESDDFALKVLRCLAQVPDIRVHVLARDSQSPTKFSRHRAEFFTHTVDGFDEKRLDVILQTAKQIKPDVILPVDQPTIRLIAKYQSEAQSTAALPPLASAALIDLVSDKWLLTEFLKKENIPHPATILHKNDALNGQNFEALSFPVLLKPLDSSGGVGILYFKDSTELSEYLKKQNQPERFVIQSFVTGYDIDCSVLCQNGEILAYTIQKAFIAGKQQFMPADSIDFLYHERVHAVVKQLMCSLHWSGIAHIDLRYDEIEVEAKIIEINPRYWGSLLGSLVAGINFPHLACLTSMKINYPRPDYQFIRYTKPEIAVNLLINKYLKGDRIIQKFSDTGLPFILRDPTPELHKGYAKISKKIFQKAGVKI